MVSASEELWVWIGPSFTEFQLFFSSYLAGFTRLNWVSMGFARFMEILRSTRFYRVLLGFTGFYWVLPGFYRVLLGFAGFYWVLPGFNEFYWVFLGFTDLILRITGFY